MSVTRRIKYFKQIAILLTIFWTLLTAVFAYYQFFNEEKHIVESSLEKIRGVSEQSVAFIYWAYEQKAKTLSDEQKYSVKNNFSLKELLYILTKQSGMTLKIESQYQEIDKQPYPPSVKRALTNMKHSLEEHHAIFEKEGEKHIFYAKPLIASASCLGCHVHADEHVGSLLGYASIEMKIPTFKEANEQSYYFLINMYIGTWFLGLFAIWWIHLKGKNYLNEKTKLYEESMYALIDMMEKRDSYTAGHSQRVAEYSKMLVLASGYSQEDADLVYKAGMLHDIGKIEIPDAILLKPDKLSSTEYTLIKHHSMASHELLCREPFTPLASIVLHHHERYDGKGYPSGLKAEQIPFFAQIITVADAFDAMTTNRAYRKSMSKEAALRTLNEEKGKQFNPFIVELAQSVFQEIDLPEHTTQMPKDLLEEMRFSYYFRDQLTSYYNTNYLKFLFAHASDCEVNILCIDHLNCHNFAEFNKKHGWREGDAFLRRIADEINMIYPEATIVRAYSDHFLVVHTQKHEHMDYKRIDTLLESYELSMKYQHIDINMHEPISLEILEDKLLKTEFLHH